MNLVFFVTFFSNWLVDFLCRTVGNMCGGNNNIPLSHLRSVGHPVVVYRFPTFFCAFVHFSHHFHDPIISNKRNKEAEDKPGRKYTDNEKKIASQALELAGFSHLAPQT